jgi:hypothetical protein
LAAVRPGRQLNDARLHKALPLVAIFEKTTTINRQAEHCFKK